MRSANADPRRSPECGKGACGPFFVPAAGYAPDVVDRVLRLVRISEWKRHQAAPGPKVSRRAFGRERRYPISNGYRG